MPTGTMKISFAVTATPKVELIQEDDYYQAMTVIHEDVRTSLGGSGEIVVAGNDLTVNTGQWVNGNNTALTSATGNLASSAATDCLIVKNTWYLFATPTILCSDETISVLVKSGNEIVAELLSGEAIVFPRVSSVIAIATGSGTDALATAGSLHVTVEVTILGS